MSARRKEDLTLKLSKTRVAEEELILEMRNRGFNFISVGNFL